MGPIHSLLFFLLNELSKPEQADPELEFDLVLCVNLMTRVGNCYAVINLILHSTLVNAEQRNTILPAEVESTFLYLDAKLFNRIEMEKIQSRYPVDFDVGMNEPEKVTVEALVKATYERKLRAKPKSLPA